MTDLEAYAATPPPHPNPTGERASTVGRNFYPLNLTAREQELIRLAALGYNLAAIAKMLGGVRVDSIREALKRALGKQADILREEKAWERAYALQMTRLDMLMERWMPEALGSGEGAPWAADYVIKLLDRFERVQGLAAPQKLELTGTGAVGEVPDSERVAAVSVVLARLMEVASRQKVIEAQVVDETGETPPPQ